MDDIALALARPFDAGEIKWRAGPTANGKALALAYVDARLVAERLDEVLGVFGWRDTYEFLQDGSVMCQLSVRHGDEWVTKSDVGSPSEQPDEGDRVKAAVSDALKRAAVKFGVGRFLYRLPTQWVEYDPQKKRFTRQPQLPAEFATATPTQAQQAPQEVPQQEPKQELRQQSQEEHEIEAWQRWIAGEHEIGHFNTIISRDMGAVHKLARLAVWGMIKQHAAVRGWIWDAEGKAFRLPTEEEKQRCRARS